jgi:gamma-glutamyl hydrolase
MKPVVISLLAIASVALLMLSTTHDSFSMTSVAAVNDSPVIGIMTLPSEYNEYPSSDYAYLAASYVKFIESAGARVVPIPYEASNSTLETIFQNINGVLITGGGVEIYGPSKFA